METGTDREGPEDETGLGAESEEVAGKRPGVNEFVLMEVGFRDVLDLDEEMVKEGGGGGGMRWASVNVELIRMVWPLARAVVGGLELVLAPLAPPLR